MASAAASESDDEILAAVLSAPNSFRAVLRKEVFASGGFTFTIVSEIIAAAYLIVVALTLIGLYARWKRGTLWAWKQGRPNAPLLVQCLLGIYSALAAYQVYAFWFTTNPVPANYTVQLLLFLPVGLAAWMQLWGMATTLPHHRSLMNVPRDNVANNRRVSQTAKRFTLRNVRRAFPPIVIHCIFFFAPVVMIATALPAAIMAGKEHGEVITAWQVCDALLQNAAKDGWNEQSTAAIELGLEKLRDLDETLSKSLKVCATLYAAWVLIDILCFVPYAVALGNVIRKQIKHVRSSLNNSANLANISSLQPSVPTLTLQGSPNFARSAEMDKSFGSNDSMVDVPDMAPSPWVPQGASPIFPLSPNPPSGHTWQGGYNDDLNAKLRRLKRVRLIFFLNVACWMVAVVLFGLYAGKSCSSFDILVGAVLKLRNWRAVVEAAGGYRGLLAKLEYHTYIVGLLWYPALGFLISLVPATLLFVWTSYTRAGYVTSSLSIPIPEPSHVVDISALHDFAPRGQGESATRSNRPMPTAQSGQEAPPASWFSWSSRKSSISSFGNKHGKIDAASATTSLDDGMQIIVDKGDNGTRRRSQGGALAGPGVWDVRPSQWAKERSEDRSNQDDRYTEHYKVTNKVPGYKKR